MAMTKCPRCGGKVVGGTCTNCGYRVGGKTGSPPTKGKGKGKAPTRKGGY